VEKYDAPAMVPIVRGLSVSEANAALLRAGLEPVAAPERFAADDPTARVEGTYPAAGAVTRRGAKVDLLQFQFEIDGDGVDTFGWVPDTAGLDANTVIDMLRERGFQIAQFQHHYDSTYAEGLVAGTWPRAGTYTGTSGAWITIYISDGPPPPVFDPPVVDPPVILKQ
jgi:eukaryotic-like serine/threonine-protein kinase